MECVYVLMVELVDRDHGDWLVGVERVLTSEIQEVSQAWAGACSQNKQDEFLAHQNHRVKELLQVRCVLFQTLNANAELPGR